MAAKDPDLTITGWVGSPPKLYLSQDNSGVPFTQFRMAHTVRTLDRETGEYTDKRTSWFVVKSFRDLALNVADCVRQGDPVVVHGGLRIEEWVGSNEQPMRSAVLMAESIGLNLRWGTSTFSRVVRGRLEPAPIDDAEVESALARLTGQAEADDPRAELPYAAGE